MNVKQTADRIRAQEKKRAIAIQLFDHLSSERNLEVSALWYAADVEGIWKVMSKSMLDDPNSGANKEVDLVTKIMQAERDLDKDAFEGDGINIVEIGPGTGHKTAEILWHLPPTTVNYVPVDISPDLLRSTLKEINERYIDTLHDNHSSDNSYEDHPSFPDAPITIVEDKPDLAVDFPHDPLNRFMKCIDERNYHLAFQPTRDLFDSVMEEFDRLFESKKGKQFIEDFSSEDVDWRIAVEAAKKKLDYNRDRLEFDIRALIDERPQGSTHKSVTAFSLRRDYHPLKIQALAESINRFSSFLDYHYDSQGKERIHSGSIFSKYEASKRKQSMEREARHLFGHMGLPPEVTRGMMGHLLHLDLSARKKEEELSITNETPGDFPPSVPPYEYKEKLLEIIKAHDTFPRINYSILEAIPAQETSFGSLNEILKKYPQLLDEDLSNQATQLIETPIFSGPYSYQYRPKAPSLETYLDAMYQEPLPPEQKEDSEPTEDEDSEPSQPEEDNGFKPPAGTSIYIPPVDNGLVADLTGNLDELEYQLMALRDQEPYAKNMVWMLGNTLGNFHPEQQNKIFRTLYDLLDQGDSVVLGVALAPDINDPQYSDKTDAILKDYSGTGFEVSTTDDQGNTSKKVWRKDGRTITDYFLRQMINTLGVNESALTFKTEYINDQTVLANLNGEGDHFEQTPHVHMYYEVTSPNGLVIEDPRDSNHLQMFRPGTKLTVGRSYRFFREGLEKRLRSFGFEVETHPHDNASEDYLVVRARK